MKTIRSLATLTLLSFTLLTGCSATTTNPLETASDEEIVGVANWANDAVAVEEVREKATLIVRAKAQSQTEQLRTDVLPSYGFPHADPSTPLEELDPDQIENVGEHTSYTPYTETTFEVVKVYKGDSPATITIRQLGGTMPHPVEEGQEVSLSLEGNPVYSLGSEHFLFLVPLPNIDQRFAVTGPPGHYEVQGELVVPTLDLSKFAGRPIQVPKTVTELETRLTDSANP